VHGMIKVSVVTAVFNGEKTIAQAIGSVLSQDYPAVESVVIDGASRDATLSILEPYRPRLGKLISEPDDGIYAALNKGIRHATGDVVGFLHADDLFENDGVLGKVAAAFEDPDVDAVYGDLVYVRHDNVERVVRYWKSGSYDQATLARGWMPPHPTFYVRRTVYERLGGFDTRYKIAADYDTVLRFLAVGRIRAAYIPEVLVRMRTGGISNRSLKTILRKSREDYEAVRRNRSGGILTILQKNFSKLNQFWQK
jgi:glycosyltransferase involved in cell wall biosynthesis